eukprot:10217274-Prorocentrum_lima.AAC.1
MLPSEGEPSEAAARPGQGSGMPMIQHHLAAIQEAQPPGLQRGGVQQVPRPQPSSEAPPVST